jgi:predicted ArsR family transcriptional regulator
MVTATARQKILALIERRGTASSVQIGHSLNMSTATVRHHLSILLADGRIVVERPDLRPKRGRPARIFRLSDRLLGEGLGALSDAILDVWLEGLPRPEREAAARRIGERIAGQVGGLRSDLPVAKRLVDLTDRLNRIHYHARWEAGAQGPHILLGHCPYATIIERHPELCAADSEMLANLMGASFEQISKIDRKPGGATHCVFAMRHRAPGAVP